MTRAERARQLVLRLCSGLALSEAEGRVEGLDSSTAVSSLAIRSWFLILPTAYCLLLGGCGYTTRPGLPSHLTTVYVKPFINKIDFTQLDTDQSRFPLYRHRMEVDLTNAVVSRFQFTGLMRPASQERASARLEGDLMAFRRDALRYNASQQIEEWRLNVVVNLRFIDQTSNTVLWEEQGFTGDTTYLALGANAETESTALGRAITDLARRIVERAVENW